MEVIIVTACGGISPKTKRAWAFAASDTPVKCEPEVGKELIKVGYAKAVKRTASTAKKG